MKKKVHKTCKNEIYIYAFKRKFALFRKYLFLKKYIYIYFSILNKIILYKCNSCAYLEIANVLGCFYTEGKCHRMHYAGEKCPRVHYTGRKCQVGLAYFSNYSCPGG